jgi:hypothetical protein
MPLLALSCLWSCPSSASGGPAGKGGPAAKLAEGRRGGFIERLALRYGPDSTGEHIATKLKEIRIEVSSSQGGAVAMPVNRPPWRKLTVHWDHIAERHIQGGAFTNARTVFGQVDLAHVKQIVKGAYQNAKKIATQGASHGWTVEMWLNVETKVLETAYPVL